LRRTCEADEIRVTKLKKILRVRWMTSHERAFNTLYREYSTVLDVLKTIAVRDESFERYISPQVSVHAARLGNRMSEKHFTFSF
jgi:hypothetical protein